MNDSPQFAPVSPETQAALSDKIAINKVPAQYRDLVQQSAQQYNIPPSLLASTLYAESRFNPKAHAPDGGMGISQFMPKTWQQYGGSENPYDPNAAIPAAAKYLSDLYQQSGGDPNAARVGYNAGPNTMMKYLQQGHDLSAIPSITRNYLQQQGGFLGSAAPSQPSSSMPPSLSLPIAGKAASPSISGEDFINAMQQREQGEALAADDNDTPGFLESLFSKVTKRG